MPTTRRRTKVVPLAIAVFNTDNVKGEVVCRDLPNHKVQVKSIFHKLPKGEHGYHIHTNGDLRGEGCKGACAHYHVGPHQDHGGPPASHGPRHTGDLGNIEMPAKGPLVVTHTIAKTSVRDLWGRSVIVHADPDDYGQGEFEDSKITGHSGARIACAVLGRGSESKC